MSISKEPKITNHLYLESNKAIQKMYFYINIAQNYFDPTTLHKWTLKALNDLFVSQMEQSK